MVARHLHVPHRFVCITDDPRGMECETFPLWDGPAVKLAPTRPNCYRRLRLWSEDAGGVPGDRFLSIDLDAVICGDITPLVQRDEDLVIWGDTAKGTPYNGSLWLLRKGARRRVWDEFDPVRSPQKGKALRYIGSDQAWIGACLGTGEAKYTAADGVYSFRNNIQHHGGELPSGARIVLFHGNRDPWGPECQRLPWVREHWR